MRAQTLFRALLLSGGALLAACSGGNTISGESDGGDSGGGGTTPGPTASSLTVLASAPQLSSSASTSAQGVTLTAIVKDANNNILTGQTVNFSASSGTLVGGSNLVTDSSGQAQATLHTAGEPANRTITVTATSGSLTRQISIAVVGTTLAITGPDNAQRSTQAEYVIQLKNSAGTAIAGEVISVSTNSGNTLSSASLTTDSSGQVTIQLSATVASTTITASAFSGTLTATKSVSVSTDQFEFLAPVENKEISLGASETISIRWLRSGAAVADGTTVNFSATRGTFSATTATTSGGVATVSISAIEAGFSKISASGSLQGTSVSTSRTVEFVAVTPTDIQVQASPAVIATNGTSEISAVVRDGAKNLVKNANVLFSINDPTGGILSSPEQKTDSQGTAKVTYTAGTTTSAKDGVTINVQVQNTSVTDSATLTVGSQAARITIGTGSQIISKDASTYQLPFTVVVTDAAGNPAPNAEFTLSVEPESFRKGTFASTNATCPNEDVNLDSIVDPGEDADADGVLDPGNVASVPPTVQLDPDDGTGQFNLTYPKDRGLFVTVRVIGRAKVAGSEATEVRSILLTVAEDDVDNLPGVSPYGVSTSCADPN